MADLKGILNVANIVGKLSYTEKPLGKLYLITNQGMGIYVFDFSDYSESYYTNADMMKGVVQIAPGFHVDFNNVSRNCLTIVADSNLSVHWRRSSSPGFNKEDYELKTGETHLLYGASEFGGYAIVICE